MPPESRRKRVRVLRDPRRQMTPEGRTFVRRLEAGKWVEMRMLALGARRRGRLLIVSCQPAFDGTYTVLAIEMGMSAGSLEGALDNHAHQVVAEHLPRQKARGVAAAFLRSWKAGKPTLPRPDVCACGPIVDDTTHRTVRTVPAASSGRRGALPPPPTVLGSTMMGPPPPFTQWVFGQGKWQLLGADGTHLGTLEVPPAASGGPKALPASTPAKPAKSRLRAV